MTNRERFEAWVTAPPFEKSVARHADDSHLWPGQYCDIAVQLAWKALEEATRQAKEVTP